MKQTTRIVMGLLFPFILFLTVTTISKALKSDSSSNSPTKQPVNSSKNNPVNTNEVKVILTGSESE